MKDLSIVTITYNNPNLRRTLDSVLTQVYDWNMFEHIIVDNMSTDETKKIVTSYSKQAPYKVVYIREKDSGRYDAMNKGVKKSNGKYLNFLNAGDEFYNNQSISNLLSNSNDYDILYGNIETIDSNNKISSYTPPDKIDFKYFLNYALPHQATLIKRQLFTKIGLYDFSYKICADWKFFLLAVCKYCCTYFHINKLISRYYLDGISSKPESRKIIDAEKMAVYDNFFSKNIKKNIKKNNNNNKLFKTPVLLIIFNRPTTTQKVFNIIKKIKPKYLFIAADGPRPNKLGEKDLCKQTRNIIKQIDWNCNLNTLYRDTNFGCGHAVSSAITWFFNQVNYGIILEDDCLPDPTFFYFCKDLLNKYKNNHKIWHIAGYQFIPNYKSEFSYYFAKNMHCWGWASWSNRWKYYDFELRNFKEEQIKYLSRNPNVISYFKGIFNLIRSGEIDTWDYQWAFTIIANKGICINPSKNLISNIGFGYESTHTSDPTSLSANLKTSSINHINHPKNIIVDQKAVNNIFENHYGINTKQKSLFTENITNKIKSLINKIKTFYENQQM